MFEAQAALEGLIAERQLIEHGRSAFSPDGVYLLVLKSTGDEELAEEARAARQTEIMDAMDRRNSS